jgi:hypothetical protein
MWCENQSKIGCAIKKRKEIFITTTGVSGKRFQNDSNSGTGNGEEGFMGAGHELG